MSSSVFDGQIRELAIRSLAYHDKCQSLWVKQPPPPHFGAPFLFAYIWSIWSVDDRRALIESARESVEQNIAQMLSQGGQSEDQQEKMHLLLAACVPEIFQDELFTELRPMAQLLAGVWRVATKTDRVNAIKQRPKHISAEMTHIDKMPFVWQQPVVTLIEQTLQLLHYKVFATPEKLSTSENESYQRDLLLSLRAFWMNLFCLQIFMNLSDHFHKTELMLLAQQQQQNNASSSSPSADSFRKPINTMRIEEVVEEAISASAEASEETKAVSRPTSRSSSRQTSPTLGPQPTTTEPPPMTHASTVTSSTDSTSSTSSDPHVLPNVPANTYCVNCHASPLAALLSVTKMEESVSIIDPISKAANKEARKIELKRCSRCKQVWYCSVECQKKHHKEHKKVCKSQEDASSSAPTTISENQPTVAGQSNTEEARQTTHANDK